MRTAVDAHLGAGDEGAVVGRKHRHDTGDSLWAGEAAEDPLDDPGLPAALTTRTLRQLTHGVELYPVGAGD